MNKLTETRPVFEFEEAPKPRLPPPPPLYTRGLHEQICQNIRAGNRPHVAAQMAGLTARVFYDWMKRGRDGDAHLWEFAQDVELAEGLAEGEALQVITTAFKDNPEHAKWFLERARGAGWSKESNARVNEMIRDFMMRLRDGLPPEIYQMVLAVANGDSPELQGPAKFALIAPTKDAESSE